MVAARRYLDCEVAAATDLPDQFAVDLDVVPAPAVATSALDEHPSCLCRQSCPIHVTVTEPFAWLSTVYAAVTICTDCTAVACVTDFAECVDPWATTHPKRGISSCDVARALSGRQDRSRQAGRFKAAETKR